MKKNITLVIVGLLFFIPQVILAHCPLCTAGAGILAITAAYFGLSSMIIGVLIGAFALALSLWLKNWPRKQYIAHQRFLLGVLIFAGTVVPIMPLVVEYAPFYIPFWGEYGRTFAVNLYLAGLPFGMLVVLVAPRLSQALSVFRGKTASYQGIFITLLLLIVVSAIIQILL